MVCEEIDLFFWSKHSRKIQVVLLLNHVTTSSITLPGLLSDWILHNFDVFHLTKLWKELLKVWVLRLRDIARRENKKKKTTKNVFPLEFQGNPEPSINPVLIGTENPFRIKKKQNINLPSYAILPHGDCALFLTAWRATSPFSQLVMNPGPHLCRYGCVGKRISEAFSYT